MIDEGDAPKGRWRWIICATPVGYGWILQDSGTVAELVGDEDSWCLDRWSCPGGARRWRRRVDPAGPLLQSQELYQIGVKAAGQDRGTYYHFKANLAYKGEPLDFDIVVGCNVRIMTYKDNDQTVEVGIAPTAFGLR